jgi:hypothetical protein
MGFDNDHLGTLMPFGAPSTPSFHCESEIGFTAKAGVLILVELRPQDKRP